MNKEWLDCLMEMPISEYDAFKGETKLESVIDLSKKFDNADYSWISVVEKYLPFLKSTMESAFLLIDDLEEAKKSYENRFLCTLLKRLDEFLKKQYELLLETENSSDESSLKINGNSFYKDEEISLELSLKIHKKEIENKKSNRKQAKERLDQIFLFLGPITSNPLLNTLEGISLVRSPIRRIGMLETHENYKKLIELYDFLDSYSLLEKAFSGKEKENDVETFMIPYFMSYQLFSEKNVFLKKDEDFLKKYLEGIIRQFLEESDVDEKSFKKLITKTFEDEYTKKKNREKNIQQIFTHSLDTYQKQVKDAIRALKS